MAAVVSNTGPIIALADIDQLGLLRQLFAATLIPPAVRAEVSKEPALSALQAALADGWLSEQSPADAAVTRLLNETLDLGESQAIALAQQVEPAWIILDDLAARHIAQAIGLAVIGTLGVLLLAKDAGYVAQVKPLLDKLRAHSLYVSEALYTSILKNAAEAD